MVMGDSSYVCHGCGAWINGEPTVVGGFTWHRACWERAPKYYKSEAEGTADLRAKLAAVEKERDELRGIAQRMVAACKLMETQHRTGRELDDAIEAYNAALDELRRAAK